MRTHVWWRVLSRSVHPARMQVGSIQLAHLGRGGGQKMTGSEGGHKGTARGVAVACCRNFFTRLFATVVASACACRSAWGAGRLGVRCSSRSVGSFTAASTALARSLLVLTNCSLQYFSKKYCVLRRPMAASCTSRLRILASWRSGVPQDQQARWIVPELGMNPKTPQTQHETGEANHTAARFHPAFAQSARTTAPQCGWVALRASESCCALHDLAR